MGPRQTLRLPQPALPATQAGDRSVRNGSRVTLTISACDLAEGPQGPEGEALPCEAGTGRRGQAGLLPDAEARGSVSAGCVGRLPGTVRLGATHCLLAATWAVLVRFH